jgi:hypothetical protein
MDEGLGFFRGDSLNKAIHAEKSAMPSGRVAQAGMPHFIKAGFDVLNPVQCSARGMDADIHSAA